MKIGIFLHLLLPVSIAIAPIVSADELGKGAGAGEGNITMNITSPKEGEVGYTDVLGSPITIEVEVNSPMVSRVF